MTAVDRPDNGQDEGPWRVGSHYGIHVYADDRPLGTFLRPEDAARAVTAVNGRAGAGEQQRAKAEKWLADSIAAYVGSFMSCYDDCPDVDWQYMAEDFIESGEVIPELTRLLGGPQPDGEVRQHRMDADCWCQPVQHPSGAWDHQ